MRRIVRLLCVLGSSMASLICLEGSLLYAQDKVDPNAAPNPYRMTDFSLQLPEGRKLGAPIGVEIDHSDGKTLWIFDRCGGDTCVGSDVAPLN